MSGEKRIPLSKIKKLLGNKSNEGWETSKRFDIVSSAHFWNMDINTFDSLPESAQIEMIAFARTKTIMEAYENYLQNERIEKESRESKRKR